jgi:hypothetical protein
MRPLLAAALLALPLPAAAYALPPATRPAPPSGVAITGEATVRDARAVVRCDAVVLTETFATCRVDASFEVATRSGATLTPVAASPDVVRFNGRAAATRTLPPGGSLRVTVTGTRRLGTSTSFRGGPWVLSPAAVRHPFLGESSDLEHRGDSESLPLYVGERVSLEGAITLDVGDEPAVRVTAVASTATYDPRAEARTLPTVDDAPRVTAHYAAIGLSVSARDTPDGPLRNGGPVIAFGVRGPVDQQDTAPSSASGGRGRSSSTASSRPRWRWTASRCSSRSWWTSGPPELAIMIPSLRAGVGVVARQLGPRPPDFALRLRVGASLLPAGFDADFDYWPTVSGWTLSFTARLSP